MNETPEIAPSSDSVTSSASRQNLSNISFEKLLGLALEGLTYRAMNGGCISDTDYFTFMESYGFLLDSRQSINGGPTAIVSGSWRFAPDFSDQVLRSLKKKAPGQT